MRGFRKITIEEWTDNQRTKSSLSISMKECKCGQLYWSDEKEEHEKSKIHEVFTSQGELLDTEDCPRDMNNPLDYGLSHPKPST